jgi:hypothetical protein
MASDYIPSTDTGCAAWAENFSTLITATPGAYGLMASDAVTIATSFNLFNAALTLVLNPLTKTKATVADKNGKRAAMLSTLRQYSQVIKRNLGVSNEAKIGLGLTIDDSGRTPIPAPTTAPILSIFNAAPLHHSVRFVDETSPDRRAKPAGVQGVLLAVAVGTTPPVDFATMPVQGLMTRQNFDLGFALPDKGKNAYYAGRFVTPSGLPGPWSALAQLTIAG